MKSIRRQLSLSLIPAFALLLACSSAAIYFSTRTAVLRAFDASLRAKATTIMSLTEQGSKGIQVELPEGPFQASNNDMFPQYYEVWRTDGQVCTRSPGLKNTDLDRRFDRASSPVYWNLALPGGRAGRAIGLRFTPKSEDEDGQRATAQDAVVVVAADRHSLDRTLGTLGTVLAVTGLLTICVAIPIVNVTLHRGHSGLASLGQQAAAITADSLQTRFPADSAPEELVPITSKLNDLLGRLERSFERERRFSADLAHELRTPLAELRSHAEVELAWPDSSDTKKHLETLEIAKQMESMVTRLLDLARCENGKIALQTEPVPLAELVEEVWRPLAAKARAKQLDVSFPVAQDAQIQTDRVLLQSILVNLFSNAVEYTPQTGWVIVSWQGETRALSVSNTVHDLNSDDMPHLFERLWRKDKSRTGNEHCGLGLALSREYAAMLNASLTAVLGGEKRLTVNLTFSSASNNGPAPRAC